MPSITWTQLLAVFNITAADLAVLHADSQMVDDLLPGVLSQMHGRAASGSSLTAAVRVPAVRDLRTAYWHAVATGGATGDLMAIGRSLGEAYAQHSVPTQQLTTGQSTTMLAIMDAVKAGKAKRRRHLVCHLSGYRNAYKRQTAFRNAISKLTWLGLSMILEGHDQGQAARKRDAFETIERSFSS